MNRLYGMRTYLVGAMESVPDGGTQWRSRITPWLNSRGVLVFNPCDKPLSEETSRESPEDRAIRKRLLEQGKYDEMIEHAKMIRPTDLRMVDITDFIIAYIDKDSYATGTYEEISWANRQKKPILVVCEQGKREAPPWLFLMLKKAHHTIFDDWSSLQEYLDYIDECPDTPDTLDRWMFFDIKKLQKQADIAYRKRQKWQRLLKLVGKS